MKYIFGPVPSRRLGLSLGIDLIPYKTCTLNCIYCECGPTTRQTVKRSRFFDPSLILKELQALLKTKIKLDYITFSGAGEPCLNSDLEYLIMEIKKITGIPIAVITNGSLLSNKNIRKTLLRADLVMPSLDSARQTSFKQIDNPLKQIKINKIIRGLIDFRKEYNGKIWLEIFFVKNINDSKEDINALIKAVQKIKPDKVQLNSIDRPPAVSSAKSITKKQFFSIKKQFNDNNIKNIEIITSFSKNQPTIKKTDNNKTRIINLIKRRPETTLHLSQSLGISLPYINKLLKSLENENLLIKIKMKQEYYYTLKHKR